MGTSLNAFEQYNSNHFNDSFKHTWDVGQSILEDLVFLVICRGVRTRGAWAIFAHSGSWTRSKWNGNSETAIDPVLHVTKYHCTFCMGTPLYNGSENPSRWHQGCFGVTDNTIWIWSYQLHSVSISFTLILYEWLYVCIIYTIYMQHI